MSNHFDFWDAELAIATVDLDDWTEVTKAREIRIDWESNWEGKTMTNFCLIKGGLYSSGMVLFDRNNIPFIYPPLETRPIYCVMCSKVDVPATEYFVIYSTNISKELCKLSIFDLQSML